MSPADVEIRVCLSSNTPIYIVYLQIITIFSTTLHCTKRNRQAVSKGKHPQDFLLLRKIKYKNRQSFYSYSFMNPTKYGRNLTRHFKWDAFNIVSEQENAPSPQNKSIAKVKIEYDQHFYVSTNPTKFEQNPPSLFKEVASTNCQ